MRRSITRLTRRLAVLAGALLAFGALTSPGAPAAIAQSEGTTYAQDDDSLNIAQNRIRTRNLSAASNPQTLTFNVALGPTQTLVGATLISGSLSFTLSIGTPAGLPAPACTGLPSTSVNSHALKFCTSTATGVYPVTLTRVAGEGDVAIFNATAPNVNNRLLSNTSVCPTVEKRGVQVYQYSLRSGDEDLKFRVRSASAMAYGRLYNNMGRLVCLASGHWNSTNPCTVDTVYNTGMYMVVLNTKASGNDERVETLLYRDRDGPGGTCFS